MMKMNERKKDLICMGIAYLANALGVYLMIKGVLI